MADELETGLGVESELIPGHGGVFEVEYSGKLVFSKKSLGRFPNQGEILDLLQKK